MKSLSQSAMLEATRLTREGRLSEAMDVLRGASPTAHPETPDTVALIAGTPTLDLEPPTPASGGAWSTTKIFEATSAKAGQAKPAPLAAGLTGLMKRFEGHQFASGLPGLNAANTAQDGVAVPPGARFEERVHASEAGSRTYKLYVPSGYDGTPLPLVVMLHGCTQSPDDFAAGTRMNELAERQGVLVAYPAQARSANNSRCWNWFNPADQERGRGEPAIIAGIAHQIMNDYSVDKDHVFVAGLSAGGATAAIMGARYPEIFSAVGVHSGLACGAASDVGSAFTAMRQGALVSPSSARITVPTIVFHGDRDQTVNPANADRIVTQTQTGDASQARIVEGTSQGGMRFTRTVRTGEAGQALMELWVLHGADHAWSGGSLSGSYTDPRGPDASAEMLRFFLGTEERPSNA